jgi:hypothetical protein
MAAGRELAWTYSGFRKNPRLLLDLALSLKASERDGAAVGAEIERTFAAGFVNEFGAANMVFVPRAIQAMEWSQALKDNNDPFNRWLAHDVATAWTAEGNDGLKQDPLKEYVAPFAVMLANATYSGRLSRTVENGIAEDEDTWATAQLVSQGGTFNTPFLVKLFNTGVVDKIVAESRERVAGDQPVTEYGLGQMWSHGKESLPLDTKQIILDAVARNGTASVLALTEKIHVEPFDQSGQKQTVTNPVALLYQYGHFEDHGAAFANVYTKGDDWGYANDRQGAGKMTLSVVDQLLKHDRGDAVAPVTDALARGLAGHWMGDLHSSSSSAYSNPDPDRDGIVGEANSVGIALSKNQVQHLVATLINDPTPREHFLNGVTAYQANLIDAGVAGHRPVDDWAKSIGSFDGVLNSANEANNVHDVQAALAREQAITSALDGVVSLVHLPPGVDIVAHQVPQLLAHEWGPHGESATDRSGSFHDQLQAQMQTAITSGYVSAHPDIEKAIPAQVARMPVQSGFTPETFLDQHHHVLPWSKMNDAQQRTFIHWYSQTNSIQHLSDAARSQAIQAFSGNDEDNSGN